MARLGRLNAVGGQTTDRIGCMGELLKGKSRHNGEFLSFRLDEVKIKGALYPVANWLSVKNFGVCTGRSRARFKNPGHRIPVNCRILPLFPSAPVFPLRF
jgi:hypothetical protein